VAQGLHLRLPDRDRRLQRAERRVRRSRRTAHRPLDRQRLRHLAWRQSREDLGAVAFPWLSDIKREFSSALGILDKTEGVALRATFIVDPEGIIRYVGVNDLSVGRNPREVLRILDALQTDELCPCNWQAGQDTLQAA